MTSILLAVDKQPHSRNCYKDVTSYIPVIKLLYKDVIYIKTEHYTASALARIRQETVYGRMM
jgi:hypothetical protein